METRTNNLARLYSGKRGSSGSTRPVSRRPPAWFKYEPEEVDALVLKLSKEGNTPSLIGQILRDRYGIPLVSQVAGRRLGRPRPISWTIIGQKGTHPAMPARYASSLNGENYTGAFSSREEALNAAIEAARDPMNVMQPQTVFVARRVDVFREERTRHVATT